MLLNSIQSNHRINIFYNYKTQNPKTPNPQKVSDKNIYSKWTFIWCYFDWYKFRYLELFFSKKNEKSSL